MVRKVDGAIEIALQQLIETGNPMRDASEEAIDLIAGPDGVSLMQALLEEIFSTATLVERERHLEVWPHKRLGCQDYAHGYPLGPQLVGFL